jgi:hemerythrin-like domain-containing protein
MERPVAAEPGPATAELRHEHEVILRGLDVLERLADRLAAGQPVKDTTLSELVQLFQTFADRCHHGKEEDQLFPAMRMKGMGATLAVFVEEHEEGRGYLRTLGTGASGAERVAAARRYVGLLREHIQRENDILFPMADELFSAEEHRALARAYEDVELRVVGPGIHERPLTTLTRLDDEASAVGSRS